MRFYIGDFGNETITFVDEEDEIIDLTGRTTEWHIRNRDGTIPAATPISGIVIGDPVNGQVNFNFPASLTTAKIKYSSIMKILESGVLIKSSILPISIDVDSIEGS